MQRHGPNPQISAKYREEIARIAQTIAASDKAKLRISAKNLAIKITLEGIDAFLAELSPAADQRRQLTEEMMPKPAELDRLTEQIVQKIAEIQRNRRSA